MSKYVKNLICNELRQRLQGVEDALLVNVIGLDANTTHRLRAQLRQKDIRLLVVKNSLAARATAGTPLASMFAGLNGSAAICWGGPDLVCLAKEVARLASDGQFAPFAVLGGVMAGQRLLPEQVLEVSKWPTRGELLANLAGQILGPGARLVSQLSAPGRGIAGQLQQLASRPEEATAGAPSEGG
ncbi:MAG: 50S ribosomal protein L10 [Thermoguttaceae bacterium]